MSKLFLSLFVLLLYQLCKSSTWDLNPEPAVYKTDALPIALVDTEKVAQIMSKQTGALSSVSILILDLSH